MFHKTEDMYVRKVVSNRESMRMSTAVRGKQEIVGVVKLARMHHIHILNCQRKGYNQNKVKIKIKKIGTAEYL